MNEQLVTDILAVIPCCECGIMFGIPRDFDTRRQESGGNFFCPSGHSLSYTETKVARLEKQLAATRATLDQSNAKAREEQSLKEKAIADLAKVKKRVARGVCPVCRRNFVSLGKHMKHKHPHF